ncbi:hypothetical protein HPB48_011144 [Haemaphysalis longicornis]|uniref:Uncharacterized protein n=1 Tax=Haemaphysalis longicornis TaxID=44386 RepID=A0A9J6GJM7_HAELO|nr:hypothetical protein HPB48_011144 [Haemaphysalis longicornis]
MTGTSSVYHIMPSSPTSIENIPHHATVQRCPILIQVAGRPTLCLQLYHMGHYRRSCQTPCCRSCPSFGYDHTNCTLSYAARTKQRASVWPQVEEYMNADDMAAMIGTTSQEAGEALPFPSSLPPNELNKKEPVYAPLKSPPAVELSRTTEFLSPVTTDATSKIDEVTQTQSTLPPLPLCIGGAYGTASEETPMEGEEEQQLVGHERRQENGEPPSGASKTTER